MLLEPPVSNHGRILQLVSACLSQQTISHRLLSVHLWHTNTCSLISTGLRGKLCHSLWCRSNYFTGIYITNQCKRVYKISLSLSLPLPLPLPLSLSLPLSPPPSPSPPLSLPLPLPLPLPPPPPPLSLFQGVIIGTIISSFYLSNFLSPVWRECRYCSTHDQFNSNTVIESYRLSGNHNYINAGITCLILLSMMAGLVALFRKLAPRQSRSSELQKTWEANNTSALELDTVV